MVLEVEVVAPRPLLVRLVRLKQSLILQVVVVVALETQPDRMVQPEQAEVGILVVLEGPIHQVKLEEAADHLVSMAEEQPEEQEARLEPRLDRQFTEQVVVAAAGQQQEHRLVVDQALLVMS